MRCALQHQAVAPHSPLGVLLARNLVSPAHASDPALLHRCPSMRPLRIQSIFPNRSHHHRPRRGCPSDLDHQTKKAWRSRPFSTAPAPGLRRGAPVSQAPTAFFAAAIARTRQMKQVTREDYIRLVQIRFGAETFCWTPTHTIPCMRSPCIDRTLQSHRPARRVCLCRINGTGSYQRYFVGVQRTRGGKVVGRDPSSPFQQAIDPCRRRLGLCERSSEDHCSLYKSLEGRVPYSVHTAAGLIRYCNTALMEE